MYQNLFAIKGKTALITGGTSGLGNAIAECFLCYGANVIVCGREPEKVDYLQDLANEHGCHYYAIDRDVTKQNEIDDMMNLIGERFTRVDFLLNCAGINKLLPAEDYDGVTFEKVMGVNVTGTHLMCKSVAKRFFIPQNFGRIVNISSVKSFIGAERDYIAYCASKGAINMYTKQLACEWAKFGINCNAIAPTFVKTPINAKQLEDPIFYQSLVSRIPLERIGEKKDIAGAAMFLCSDASSFVSGHILAVDGGLTAKQ